MKASILLLSIAMLAGCATSPVPLTAAKAAPADRIYAFQDAQGPNDGQIVLVRDSGVMGSGCRADIYVDAKQAATLSTSEKVVLTLTAGAHLVATAPTDRGLCGLGGANESLRRTVSVNVKAGHTQTFRVAILGDGGATLMPTSL